MLQVQASITDRTPVGGCQHIQLYAPEMATRLRPGQALLVRTGPGYDPYLRRTYYPVGLSADSFVLRLLPGEDRGDAWLRVLPIGSQIDCLGPVGRSFELPSGIRRLLCLGFDDLVWSLLPLVWQATRQQIEVTLAAIASHPHTLPQPQQLPLSVEYHRFVAANRPQFVAALPGFLRWADQVAAVAPRSFYLQLADLIREHRVVLAPGYAQVWVGASFLCGGGACLSCATDIAGGRRRVCLRGPVFDLVDAIR